MKKILMLFMLLGTIAFAQNSNDWDVDYYGALKTSYSNNLSIAVGDSCSYGYYLNNNLLAIMVDSNWTASGIGFMIYNDLEGEFYPAYNDSGIIEYDIAVGTPIMINPLDIAGAKIIKFYKLTSGSRVLQATLPSRLEIITGKY